MAHRDIVVMGASAGGGEALSALVRGFPEDLPAAVFIVLHMSADSPGLLAGVLGRHSPGMPQSAANHVDVDLQLPLAVLAEGLIAAVRASSGASRISRPNSASSWTS
jgi:two-component system chemotaxis response regulator CheB